MIWCSNDMQNKHYLVAEKATVETLSIHFYLRRKYLADSCQFQQENQQI